MTTFKHYMRIEVVRLLVGKTLLTIISLFKTCDDVNLCSCAVIRFDARYQKLNVTYFQQKHMGKYTLNVITTDTRKDRLSSIM